MHDFYPPQSEGIPHSVATVKSNSPNPCLWAQESSREREVGERAHWDGLRLASSRHPSMWVGRRINASPTLVLTPSLPEQCPRFSGVTRVVRRSLGKLYRA